MLYFSNHKIFLNLSFPMEATDVILVGNNACPYIADYYLNDFNPNIIIFNNTQELIESNILFEKRHYNIVFNQQELWYFLYQWLKTTCDLSNKDIIQWIYDYLSLLKETKSINTEDFFIEYPSKDISLESTLYKNLEITKPTYLEEQPIILKNAPCEISISIYNYLTKGIKDDIMKERVNKGITLWNKYREMISKTNLKEIDFYNVPDKFNDFKSLNDILYLGFMFDNDKYMTNLIFLKNIIKEFGND